MNLGKSAQSLHTLTFILVLSSTFELSAAADSRETTVPSEPGRLPGVALAEGITQITGVAISPLLGVCGVGTWQYIKASPEERLLLPWFCQPAAWGIGFGILSLCLLKDVFGATMPAILKKPLDIIELFEDKLSALVASAAFIPFMASQLSEHFAATGPTAGTALSDSPLAMISPILAEVPILLILLILPLSLIVFFAVWLTSHSMNVLLLLSPFSILDILLKAARVFVLASMGLIYLISPIIAASLCVIVIAIALYLAPRSFRLCVFGTVMSVDFLRSLIWKGAGSGKIRAFLARQASPTLQSRTFGTLMRDESGRIHFSSRFLLIGPRRNLILPAVETLSMQKGLIFPSVRVRLADSEKSEALLHLLPRHRYDLESVSASLGIASIHDHFVGRGLKAASLWISDTIKSDEPLIQLSVNPANRSTRSPDI